MANADLHIHTTASDGLFSPVDIVRLAKKAGLRQIALTDHDTIAGLLVLQNHDVSADTPEIIPGIEFSTDIPRYEVHILGYFVNIEYAPLNEQLHILAANRLQRSKRMVDRLRQLGYPVDWQKIKTTADTSVIGRPHIAQALVECGYFPSVALAFDALLNRGKPAYIPHLKLLPQDIIRLIIGSGGVPVLAHPGQIGSHSVTAEILRLGMRGIEVYHPSHNALQIKYYLHMAHQFGLVPTGGSDFHGIPGHFPDQLGIWSIQDELVEQLRECREG